MEKSITLQKAETLECPTCGAKPGSPCTFKFNSARVGEAVGMSHFTRLTEARILLAKEKNVTPKE